MCKEESAMFFDEEKSQAYAILTIEGTDIDVDEITRILKVNPTRTKRIGEKLQYTGKLSPKSEWSSQTEEKGTTDVSEVQIKELLDVFGNKGEELQLIKNMYPQASLQVYIVLYNHQPFMPSLGLSKEQMRFLVTHDIKLDYDIYLNM